ncbi:MAG TPA: UvrB/UvrC motif-containing protein, partial [Acidobacteriaceae bacterium]|nr:UvrB/UvrC motif-containing protein [Acidobacteriaceae bacterium]
MAGRFEFEHSLPFAPERAAEILRGVPALPGVFALRGADENAQPYLTRTANLQRRMQRLLAPSDARRSESAPEGRPLLSKRLNLSSRVARIEYTVTGSEFESLLVLYRASAAIFGAEEARRRLRLHTPFFLRFAAENPFPRIYSTNRLTKRGLAQTYGPFRSRAAADQYCEAVEDLFLIRRCHEDLHPAPEHPGCIYGEMGKCLAPCNRAQVAANAEAYSAEAAAVEAFLNTRGESLLEKLTAQREQASAELDFERAAEIHEQVQKVKAAIALADELVAPVPKLRAVIVQKMAKGIRATEGGAVEGSGSIPLIRQGAPDEWGTGLRHRDQTSDEPMAALFLLEGGCLFGPVRLSTLGVRAVREQTAVGSSLFAQPLMIEAVPLAEEGTATAAPTPTESPEARAEAAIAELEAQAAESQNKRTADPATLSDHLSLLRRWYYRPEKQRAGEVF